MMGLRKSAANAVSDLLKAQHKALLAGDLDVLGAMAPDLERAFARLARDKATKVELGQIKEASARNARLLLAAQAGVSSARATLTSSRAPELTTYGADGQSQVDRPVVSSTSLRR